MKKFLFLLTIILAQMTVAAQEPYAVYTEEEVDGNIIGTLTFYYDDNKEINNGMSIGPFYYEYDEDAEIERICDYSGEDRGWNDKQESICTVIFDNSFSNCTSITSTSHWFYDCSNLTTIIGIENLITENVTDMSYMFHNCSSLITLDVSHFDTGNVTVMSSMFYNCSSLTNLDVSHFDTGNVQGMNYMFYNCSSLTNLDVSHFDTGKVQGMYCMFCDCSSLTNLDVRHFDTGNVQGMSKMFDGCSSLTTLDVSHFDTGKVKDMSYMFRNCSSLTTLDVNQFDTGNLTGLTNSTTTGPQKGMVGVFYNCSNLSVIYCNNKWNGSNMFYGCSKLKYNNSPNSNGYFTYKRETLTAVGNDYWMTYYTKLRNIQADDKTTVYSATLSSDGKTLLLNEIPDKIVPRGQAVLLKSTISNPLIYTSTTDGKYVFENNSLIGTEYELLTNSINGNVYVPNYSTVPLVFDISNSDTLEANTAFLCKEEGIEPISLGSIIQAEKKKMPYSILTSNVENGTTVSTLTFYYDTEKDTRGGMDIIGPFRLGVYPQEMPEWYKSYDKIEKVVFDESFKDCKSITSTASWFADCVRLKHIEGLENLNTSLVEDMSYMFFCCHLLESLDLSSLNIARVKNTQGLFEGCLSLESLKLPTNIKTISNSCFTGCSSLKELIIPESVTSFGEVVFSGCSSLSRVISNIKEPFEVNLTSTPLDKTKLYVPYGTKTKYLQAGGWDVFSKIIETGVPIHGKVEAGGMPLARVEVAIVQWVDGEIYRAKIKTDANGEFRLEAFNDSTEITIVADGYGSRQFTRKNFDIGGELGTIELQQAKGWVVTLDLSFQNTVKEGTEPTIQNWYSDVNNMRINIMNQTTGTAVSDFIVRQGMLVLPTGIYRHDRIIISLHSLNDEFVDTTIETTINRDTVNVSLLLLDYGGVEVIYDYKADERLLAMLYDQSGRLVAQGRFSSSTQTFTGLKAGNYSLVTMGDKGTISSVANISDLDLMGLTEGTDYTKTTVSVRDGFIGTFHVAEVPEFDTSKFDYMAENTSFLPNKSQMVVGNFVTLTARVDFKEQYADNVSNVKVLVDIPEGCEFTGEAVVIGTKQLAFSLNGNRLTITLDKEDINERIRFCVTPMQEGTFSCTAYTSFDCGGERTQSIGTSMFEATAGTISLPENTASTIVPINGIAPAKAEVDIYDNEKLIGTTTALSDGAWSMNCELYKPYNLSTHEIYAKYESPVGVKGKTASKKCFYERTDVRVKSVTMNYYGNNYVFDYETGKTSHSWYSFVPAYDSFVFIADLTANNTTSVRSVTFYVHTISKDIRELKGFFDTKRYRWVAVSKFDSYNLPVNLSVEIEANETFSVPLADTKQAADQLNGVMDYVETTMIENKELEALEEQIETEIEKDDADYKAIKEMISQYAGFDFENEDTEAIITNDLDIRITQMIARSDSLLNEIDDYLGNESDECSLYYESEEITEEGDVWTKQVRDCEGLVVEELINQGYKQTPATEGIILSYISDDLCDYIDFKNNIRFTYTLKQNCNSRGVSKFPAISNWNALWDGIQNAYHNALADRDILERMLSQINTQRANHLERIAFEEKECRSLLNMVETDLKNEFTFSQFRNRQHLLRQLNHIEKRRARLTRLPRRISMMHTALSQINEVIDIYQRLVVNYNRIRNFNINECVKNNNPKARELFERIHKEISEEYWDYARWRICMYVTEKITDVWFGRLPAVGILLGIIEDAAINIRDNQFDRFVVTKIDQLYRDKEAAERKCKNIEEDEEEGDGNNETEVKPTNSNNAGNFPPPVTNSLTPSIDPSGYVYEAVPTNRVEGVKASIFYKEEDKPMLWDATEFSQVNPIVTDETGLYAWDVPMGQWQVLFEKSGYETTQTEWLPVPPPQLEINIPMSQAVAPTVTKAKGASSGIKVDFSKYMLPETLLTDSRISVTRNGSDEATSVELLDAEENPYNHETYASKVKVVPQNPFMTTDEVVLTVKKEVESYANKQMAADYVMQVSIEPELTSIKCDSLVVVNYTDSLQIAIQVLPAEASKGRILRVESTSPLIASVCKGKDEAPTDGSSLELTLDNEGCAQLLVGGELPGSAALHLSIVDADLEQQAQVEVIRPTKTVKAPKAVKRTNSLVEEGYLLELTSATAGATIYYTTDGSCPCNETTRKLYTGPIALNQEGDIEIRAIAVREGMEDSSVSTFHYTVTKGFNLQMTEGWNWLSIPLASMVKLSQVTGSDGDVTRVLSQTQEVIYDPVCGWVGNLSGLIGGQSYKVLTTNTRNVKLTEGTLFKNMTLQLQAGWNWMGYTCMFDAPLSHALKGMEAEENDVIYSQGRFATYSDGQWTGTLDSFAPGQGYMYKSMSQKPLVYNAEPAPQETRKATTKLTVTEQEMPWHVDVTRHPDQMAVIGMLYSHGKRVEAHTVGAFCGLECRGISTTINGKVYLTISGRSGETITLRTLEDDGRQLSIDEQLVLDGDLHGSPSNPMTLTITDEAVVGINNTTAGILSADDEPHYNVGGRRVATETVRKGEVHVKRGQSIFRK